MKILVWIGCFLVAAALQVFLGYAGIKGAIPSMAIFLAMCALANYFCKRYEEKRKKTAQNSREPLNNSLCPVSARCISRNLHLVKVISVQNGHYFSAFLLLFLKKGRLPLYQVAESFRPAMASAYKLAQANIAYSRFSFFFKPRYTVFL